MGLVGKIGGQVVKQVVKQEAKGEIKQQSQPEPPKPQPQVQEPAKFIPLDPIKQNGPKESKGGCCASCTVM